MSDALERARDPKYAESCAVCGEKFGKLQKFTEIYEHMVYDAPCCQECSSKIRKLLMYRNTWVGEDEYMQTVGRSFNYKRSYCVPLEYVKKLTDLRDAVSSRTLSDVSMADGSVFAVDQVFKMPPKPPIFILRARKVRNKMVVQGFMMKGQLKKDETVRLRIGGEVRSFKLLEVVPKRTEPFDRSQFFDELSANVHKHALKEGGEGWMILETEDCPELQKGTLLAGE